MDISISSADARIRLSELLGRVAYGKDSFLITKKGRPMARLVAITKAKGRRKPRKVKTAASRKKQRRKS